MPQIIQALEDRKAANETKADFKSKGKAACLGRAVVELRSNGKLAVDPLGRVDGRGNPKMACWFNPAKLAEATGAKAPKAPKAEAPVAEAAFATEDTSAQAKLLQAKLMLQRSELSSKRQTPKVKAELANLDKVEALIASI